MATSDAVAGSGISVKNWMSAICIEFAFAAFLTVGKINLYDEYADGE
jgi:hypothetical protein